MKNIFFNQALHQASRLAGKPGRMLRLLAQLAVKIYQSGFKIKPVQDKVKTLGRLTGAYARGHYPHIPWKTLVKILAALLYFINPFDLVPDVIPGIGLADDFTILAWVYSSVESEIDKFVAWEKGLQAGLPVQVAS